MPYGNLTFTSIAPSILAWGNEDQKKEYLPGIFRGELVFALGYSEPNAGTDLASLRTRAERDGDEWVINGQKIWTSLADVSTHIWLAVRTDPDARKHAGISIIEAIRTIILPAIEGEDIQNLNHIVDLVQGSMYTNYSAKAAVEVAVYDLFAQSFDVPLYKVLGGGEPMLSTDLTISVDYIDKMLEDAIAAVDSGFEALKIKVGKDMRLDIERVKAIYAAVSDRALIRLDANQGWTPKQTVTALRELEGSGVVLEFIEQPVRGDDIEGMKYVTERVSTP
ncbi:MAG: acyl-CoA dehydrogenase family protein, partial [Deltaproteobacteria bacterium]|nr:acyl-CoA dehydrogenase family protein [Deltaproteobacteria bacterium]